MNETETLVTPFSSQLCETKWYFRTEISGQNQVVNIRLKGQNVKV